MRFNKPCLVCGKLSLESRCEVHRAEHAQATRQRLASLPKHTNKAALYNSEYRKRAKEVRENATRCHICNQTAKVGDPWEADHVIPTDPDSPLLPAHRSCNRSKGNRV